MTQPPDALRQIVGLSPNQAPSFVPQLPPSQTWQAQRSSEAPNLSRDLLLFSSLLEIVSFLHDQGIVHRGLSPAHVHVSDSSLYLTGFERSIQLGDESIAKLTPSVYAAPEQCSLGSEAVLFEPRSDLYSLGAILYELITGAPPFMNKVGPALLLALLSEEIKPPRDCPAPLSWLCMKLLSKEKLERPGSIEEVKEEFLRVMASMSAPAEEAKPASGGSGSDRKSSLPNRQLLLPVEGESTPKKLLLHREESELPVIRPEERYEIQEEFARGGLGRVLRAYDKRLSRPVALKEILRRGVTEIEERFLREALITAKLEHPGVVPIHDLGRWEKGDPFYAMKLTEGRSLDKLIAERLIFEDRLALLPNVIAAVEAIAYAHARGVIHRALKPQNILVGAFGETIVIDWGIAKDLGTGNSADAEEDSLSSPVGEGPGPYQELAEVEGLTNEGSIIGTPAYMPPEQAQGKPVDARADVYALGAILYQVLCGQAPYVKRRSIEVLAALLDRAPLPIQEKQPEVPKALAGVVNKAMSRQPKDRYADARELVDALKRFQTGKLVGAHQYTSSELFWRWFQKNRLMVTAMLTLFVTVVLAVVIDNVRVRLHEAETARQRRKALENEALANLRGDMLAAEKEEQRKKLEELKLSQAIAWLDVDPLMSLSWLRDLDKEYPNQPLGYARLITFAAEFRGLPERVLGVFWSTPECVSKSTSKSMVFSNDGARLFSGEDDGSLRVWLLRDGQCATLKAHSSAINKLALSPDGKSLVSVGQDGAVYLWNTTYWKKTELSKEAGPVRDVAFSSDGSALAWGGEFSEVVVWDVAEGKLRSRLMASEGDFLLERSVSSLAFQPNSPLLSVIRFDGVLQSWSGSRVSQNIKTSTTKLTGDTKILFSSGGRAQIVFGVASNEILVIDLKTNKQSKLTQREVIKTAAISPDDRWLVTADADSLIWVWDLSQSPNKQTPITFSGGALSGSLQLSPDSQSIVAAGKDGIIRVFSRAGEPIFTWRGHETESTQAIIDPQGLRVASASADRTIRLWDLSKSKRFSGHSGKVWDMSFSSNGAELLTAGFDGLTNVWSTEQPSSAAPRTFSEPQTAWMLNADFSPGGYWVATASDDNTLYLRSIDGKETKLLHTFVQSPTGVDFSADGNFIWACSVEGTLTQWEVPTGKLLTTIKTPETNEDKLLSDIALLPGDTKAITSSYRGKLQLWDLSQQKPIEEKALQTNIDLYRLSLSPNGKYVVAVGESSRAIFWDLETNQSKELSVHRGVINSVAFASDEVFLTASSDGDLRAWDVATLKSVSLPVGVEVRSVALDRQNTKLSFSTAVGSTISVWLRELRVLPSSAFDSWLQSQRLPQKHSL